MFKKLFRASKPPPAMDGAPPASERQGVRHTAAERLTTAADIAQPNSDQPIRALALDGRFAEALRTANAILAGEPGNIDVGFARATVLLGWGRFQEAAAAFREAAARGAPDAATLVEMGWALFHAGQRDQALACLQRAVALEATAKSLFALAVVQQSAGAGVDAQPNFECSLALDASDYDAHILTGGNLLDLKEPEKAEPHFRNAIALDPARAGGWTNLGVALDRQERHDESEAAFRKAYELEQAGGEDVNAFVNFAVCMRHKGALEEGLRACRHLVDAPKCNGHFVYALTLATAGRLQEAWPHHEFRWGYPPLVRLRAGFAKPAWSGQDLRGKTILLRAEQGLGDTVQFLRYAPWLQGLGATVIARVQTPLVRLAKGFQGVDLVPGKDEPTPDWDFYCHPMSLPAVFGTALETIPDHGPYLRVDGDAQRKWAPRFPPTDRLRVGLVWAGSPEHQRDRYRSLPLTALARLLALDGVEFYSLQKGSPVAALAESDVGRRVHNLSAELEDFSDTAAVIEHLDLVISVDTSVAHVAGALGRPVWMMVPAPADWRWMNDRADTPWYPSMRIFRQAERGQWDDVGAEVAEAVAAIVAGTSPRPQAWNDGIYVPPAHAPRPLPAIAGDDLHLARITEARYGIVEYLPDEPVVGPSLAWYGEYLQAQLLLIMRFMPPGSVVLEAGAGVGAHALGLSLQLGPTGLLLLYEDRPRHRQVLLQNLGANSATNATLMRRSLGRPVAAPDAATDACDTIDDLALARLDWLKIAPHLDAEAILEGASETLWRVRPKLFIGIADRSGVAAAVGCATRYGYRCWLHEVPCFDSRNFNARAENVLEGQAALALLCVPEETDLDTALPDCIEMAQGVG